jgi:signal transduction histidine kinase
MVGRRRTLLILAALALLAGGVALTFDGRSLLRLISPRLRELDAAEARLREQLPGPVAPPAGNSTPQVGFHTRFRSSASAGPWVQIDLGAVVDFDTIALIPAQVAGEGYGFPLNFRVDVADEPTFQHAETVYEIAGVDLLDRGLTPVLLSPPGMRGRYLRLTATKLRVNFERQDDLYAFALGEVMVFAGGRNLALNKEVTSPDSVENPPTWSRRNLTDGRTALGPPVAAEVSQTNGYHSAIEATPDSMKWVQVDLGKPTAFDEVRLIPAHPRDFPDRFGFGFPARFKVEAADEPEFRNPVVLLDATDADYPNPGTNPVSVPSPARPARYVRVTVTKLWERTGDYVFALAELQVFADGKNVALGTDVTALDSIERGLWAKPYLVDGYASQRRLLDWPECLRERWRKEGIEDALLMIEANRRVTLERIYGDLRQAGFVSLLLLALAGVGIARAAQLRRRQEIAELRDRIARDLHDEVGSNLGSIALLGQLAQSGDMEQMRRELAEIERIARETAESMRDIVWLLGRESDAPADLLARFRETTATLLAGIEHTFEADPAAIPPRPSLDFKRHVYLILKEALHNIVKHSGAKRASVSLGKEGPAFVMDLQDDGRGFDPTQAVGGTGLRSMAARAKELGGMLSVKSIPGRGCAVRLVLFL